MPKGYALYSNQGSARNQIHKGSIEECRKELRKARAQWDDVKAVQFGTEGPMIVTLEDDTLTITRAKRTIATYYIKGLDK
jgi:hypothetical protein